MYELIHANTALDFSNTTFRKSFDFSNVEIDGLADFTNTILPPNADFSGQKDNLHFESLSGSTEEEKHSLSRYITNFRLLRQTLEKDGNFVEVHKLGRQEARARIKRGPTNDVSRTEIFFNLWYGKLSDFGQSLNRPLIWGGCLGIFSILLQWFVLWSFKKPCLNRSLSCNFDSLLFIEALDRGTVNLIPPFTTLAKRSAPSSVNQLSDNIGNITLSHHISNALSELILLFHGLGAGILVFLFILALRRRLRLR